MSGVRKHYSDKTNGIRQVYCGWSVYQLIPQMCNLI